jgi:hypothetical protein
MERWMEPFARTIDAAKKYVVSSTLDRVDWNAELVREDLGQAVQQLKRESGRGLFVPGTKLALALTELGLIDEYEFVVHPRLAGHGPTLFAGLSEPVDLKLVSRLELDSGAVAMRYRGGSDRADVRGFGLARPAGFEPATLGLEVRRTIQLCYGRVPRNSLQVRGLMGFRSWPPLGTTSAVAGQVTPAFEPCADMVARSLPRPGAPRSDDPALFKQSRAGVQRGPWASARRRPFALFSMIARVLRAWHALLPIAAFALAAIVLRLRSG